MTAEPGSTDQVKNITSESVDPHEELATLEGGWMDKKGSGQTAKADRANKEAISEIAKGNFGHSG